MHTIKRILKVTPLLVMILLTAVAANGQDSNATKAAFRKALALSDSIKPVTENKGNKTQAAFIRARRMADTTNAILSSGDPGYTMYYTDLMKRSNEYTFMHQQRSFNWQYYSGIIIFFLVIVIVILGLLLSYKQFKLNERLLISGKSVNKNTGDINRVIETTAVAGQPSEVLASNTMEISKDGIKISTAVIGLMILALSIAFFFLYLKYVYPISFIE